MPSFKTYITALAAAATCAVAQGVPDDQTDAHNLTPDYFWHNRYFALLAMSSYGDYNQSCPIQTFTVQEQLKNFPNSTLAPWELIEEWSTPSGCVGFSAVVPEMNKVVMVFKGNSTLEANWDPAVVPWSEFGINGTCQSCTANAFAVQGYNEAKLATNNWEATQNRYAGAGLVFAITGHGLGGSHSLLAAVALNIDLVAYYHHTQGTPRTFNAAGVAHYNANFNGEAGERAVWNNDQVGELFAASDDYQHAGTTFYYWGQNGTTGQPNVQICWDSPEDPACAPQDQGLLATTQEQHYFYFANVGQCGGQNEINTTWIDAYLDNTAFPEPTWAATTTPYSGVLPTATTSQYGQNTDSPMTTTTYYEVVTTDAPWWQTTSDDQYTSDYYTEDPSPWTSYQEPTSTYVEPTTTTRATRTRTRSTNVPTRYTATPSEAGPGTDGAAGP